MSIGNASVQAKLSAGFGLLAAAVLLVSWLALRALAAGHADYADYVNEDSSRAALANDILDAANARAIGARNLLLVTQASERDVEKAAIAQAQDKLKASVVRLSERVAHPDVSEQERALFTQIERTETRYRVVAGDIVELALNGKHDEAVRKMNAECRPLLATLVKASGDYIAFAQAQGALAVQAAEDGYASHRRGLYAACALAVAAALVLACVITRSISRALGAEPGQLGAAARRVAAGDLNPVDGATAAPQGSVLASLGDMQSNLARVVGQVRAASDSIATGSAQIATGNADLSQRTEEQAANLQQTAASMEQMNATVKTNADTARQANQLATTASAAAARGGEVVGQVVATMEGISASSRRIADIIGVIDGIAFQTNILALNAAVEAARAGEQGRGFAVVAGEVRNLAQRSAAAAKEIKGLIDDSAHKVESGARLVGDAGASMHEIVTQVRRVADLIGEISTATDEQTSGLGQVSHAVSQLDQVTQQNAALVEESAAAADSLSQQAGRLSELVSLFKLSQNESHAVIARARQSSRPAPNAARVNAAPALRP